MKSVIYDNSLANGKGAAFKTDHYIIFLSDYYILSREWRVLLTQYRSIIIIFGCVLSQLKPVLKLGALHS